MTFPAPGPPMRVESLCDTEQGGVDARLIGLPSEVRQLHREVLRAFLATGQPPHHADLPLICGIDRDAPFEQLSDVDVVQLEADGHVLVAYPFSGRPAGHTVQLDDGGGPVLHAMCAIDALGIPLMTGRNGVIGSADPDDGQLVRVERRGDNWRWTPDDTAVLLAQSSGCGSAADCLCPSITFHTSPRRAEDHLRARPELTGVVLNHAQAIEVARRSFGALLDQDPANWRPSPEPQNQSWCASSPIPSRRSASSSSARPQSASTAATSTRAPVRRDYGLSCRLYAGTEGVRGTPPDEWVLARLRPDTTVFGSGA